MVRRLALSTLLLSSFASVHAADGLIPGTASASVTGLSYHLIDLDPNDGIAPSIQFHNSYVLTGDAKASGTTGVLNDNLVSGDLFSSTGGTYQSSSGEVLATYSPASLTGNVQLSSASVQNLNGTDGGAVGDTARYFWGGGVGTGFGTTTYVDGISAPVPIPMPAVGDSAFTLSAHTALVIDGVAKVSTSVDLTKVASGALLDGIHTGALTADLYSDAGVMAFVIDANGNSGDSFQLFSSSAQSLGPAGVLAIEGKPLSDSNETPFSLRIDNTTADLLNSGFLLGVGGQATLNVHVVPVPEPASWAAMALGLVGLFGVARSRSRH